MKLVNGGNPAIYGGGEPRRFTRKQARAVASFVEWYK